jgi:urease accessory protein UreF
VTDGKSLEPFIRTQLHATANSTGPFVAAAHREPDRMTDFDRMCEAMLSNHVANRASRAQGQAFLFTTSRVFSQPHLTALAMRTRTEHQAPLSHIARPRFGGSAAWDYGANGGQGFRM